MTINQTIERLKDATNDLTTVVTLHRRGRTTEARDMLLQCHEVRSSVLGGVKNVVDAMERFDASFVKVYENLM